MTENQLDDWNGNYVLQQQEQQPSPQIFGDPPLKKLDWTE
jgi:hypothetical protein